MTIINPRLYMPIAPQMPSEYLKPQFALNILPLHKSHSINKSATISLQTSDNKRCEQSEQLDPIKPIFDTNSSSQHKSFKLSAKEQIPEHKYNQPKSTSLFAHNNLRINSSSNHSINSISKMPRTRTAKSTPTEARFTFSDNTCNKYIIKHRDDSVYQCRGYSRIFVIYRCPSLNFQQKMVGNSNWKGR